MEYYRIELKEQPNYYYINFVPKDKKGFSIKKLIKDYHTIIETFCVNPVK